jgi:hypothetical protein
MSYKIEKETNDVIISGWEEGIQDDPYKGIYDMRNIDVVSIPGEASVALSTQSTYTPIAVTTKTITVNAGTDVFTWDGSSTLTVNTAVTFANVGGALPAGLTANLAYYIKQVLSPTTFTVSVNAGGALKDVTGAGSGTNSFSVINMGRPITLIKGIPSSSHSSRYFLLDNINRVWVYDSILLGNTNTWVYLNNKPTDDNSGYTGTGLVVWKNYLFKIDSGGVSYLQISNLATMTTKANWHINWKTGTVDVYKMAIVSINDGNMYFCNNTNVGVLKEAIVLGVIQTFDPTSATTYVYTPDIITLPDGDYAICLAELGTNLMIGGVNNYIYPWDRVSLQYTTPIFLSENYITRMVTINTTMYIFAGYSGRIFVTNGANATPFYKIPEYLSKTTNPYIIWTDATFNRNQLYFGFSCTTNSGTTINGYGGLWAIEVDSVSPTSPRLQNIMSYGTYSGYVSALCQNRSYAVNTPVSDGYGLWIGWWSGTAGGIDIGISTPYTGGQSYIDCDPLPLGDFLKPRTLEHIQYKLGTPLVAGESVAFYYRKNIAEAYTLLPITQGNGVGDISGVAYSNFENTQWLQIRVVLTSTATNPSFVRLREVRLH